MQTLRDPFDDGTGARPEIGRAELGNVPALPDRICGTTKQPPEVLQPGMPGRRQID
jgi:hypothetical protein